MKIISDSFDSPSIADNIPGIAFLFWGQLQGETAKIQSGRQLPPLLSLSVPWIDGNAN
uniref:Uncharacterized protein n=1 Tax=Arundo donax TaxID=35708 RepID=A0A0A9AFX7_ARUDO